MSDTADKDAVLMATIARVVECAICRERCAFLGEPPCWSLDGAWPNPTCDDPGCHAIAMAVVSALETTLAGEVLT